MEIASLTVPAKRYLPEGMFENFIATKDELGNITGTQRDLDVQITLLHGAGIEVVYLNHDDHRPSCKTNGELECIFSGTQDGLHAALTMYRMLVASILDVRRRVWGSV